MIHFLDNALKFTRLFRINGNFTASILNIVPLLVEKRSLPAKNRRPIPPLIRNSAVSLLGEIRSFSQNIKLFIVRNQVFVYYFLDIYNFSYLYPFPVNSGLFGCQMRMHLFFLELWGIACRTTSPPPSGHPLQRGGLWIVYPHGCPTFLNY